jgi:histidinol dehydrogenase
MARYLKTRADAGSTNVSTVDVSKIVKDVIQTIRSSGDAAVRQYSEKFDNWSPPSFKLSQADISAAMARVPKQVIEDIKEVQSNVRAFAEAQRESIRDFELEIRPGVHLGQKNVPISSVGAYVYLHAV